MSNDLSTDQDVLITRIFDATREQVFKAWTDPDEVAAWYGPAHMKVQRNSVRIDARDGGRWEVTMVPAAAAKLRHRLRDRRARRARAARHAL